MTTLEEILAAVRTLPSEARGRLIPLLWDEVAPEDWAAPSPSWVSEAKRRSDLLDNGGMAIDDWESVRSRARRAAGLSE